MYIELLEILRCPDCGAKLKLSQVTEKDGEEIVNAVVSCECGSKYKVVEGVLDFGSKEQEFANNWSSCYEEVNYDELDRQIEEKNPESLKVLNDKAKKYIVEDLNRTRPGIILDIASGRGMLATYIAQHLDYSPALILTDLSYPVLKYDRLKIKKINPGLRVNYIACDCTHLPVCDESIDRVVSFYGITNMMDFAEDGIRETYRVLKQASELQNTVFYVDCNTDAAKEMAEAFREQLKINVFSEIISKKGLEDSHRNAGFQDISDKIIGEGIGDKNELDAIPIEGELFALAVINAVK